jgi:hypothetical protein
MISAAQVTIFGPLLPLDLQQLSEKSSADESAAGEFCRMKIDFRTFATKLRTVDAADQPISVTSTPEMRRFLHVDSLTQFAARQATGQPRCASIA